MISQKTRDADEKLREELKHVDPEKLKKVINAVVAIKSKLKRKR